MKQNFHFQLWTIQNFRYRSVF